MRVLLGDFWAELFTFDSRFFRSIVPLIIKPGELTLEYTRGRRVRYIPPLRFFLFITILFFFLLTVRVNPMLDDGSSTDAGAADSSLADSVVITQVIYGLGQLPESARTPETEALRASLLQQLEQNRLVEQAASDSAECGDEADENEDTAFTVSDARLIYKHRDVTDSKAAIFRGALKIGPKAVFLLLPVFALYLALIYIRSRRMFIEHLVFALHYHALLFLLFAIAALSGKPIAWLLAPPIGGIYLLFAMRRVYQQGWRKTLLKHFMLTTIYNMTFVGVMGMTIGSSVYLLELSEKHPWILGWLL